MAVKKRLQRLFAKARKGEDGADAAVHEARESVGRQLTHLRKAESYVDEVEDELERREYILAEEDADELVDDRLKEARRHIEDLRHQAAALKRQAEEAGKLLRRTRELLQDHFRDAAKEETGALAEAERLDADQLARLKDELVPDVHRLEKERRDVEEKVLDLSKEGAGAKHAFMEAVDGFRKRVKALRELEGDIRSSLRDVERAVDKAYKADADLRESIKSFLAQRERNLGYKKTLRQIRGEL